MDASRVNVNRAPCALCTTKNKRCPKNCEFAPYFPAEKLGEFESAHKLFGTPNIMKMMRLVSEDENKGMLASLESSILIENKEMLASFESSKLIENQDMLASSILMEGDAWKKDPVRGGFGIIQKLKWQIELRKLYLNELKEKIKVEKEKTELRL
ncbi:unnamed protein product [Arabidopsis lyrata]|uniref:LOB domain-containing protein 9 n=1 Tax=Arabidopsis lyrata subsp. lyrata TaxID=81972 RepID=UPI000A29B0D3|nr:LOB domain-containing protein 9 [Arabidopsis lyrata subsp. lyrata]CAH8261351.1 unnamed protein product [Arabidopsis lyrata]|eukprot:XP_020888773.1 LOB domain-containing protein 9 [Arabidopsis lyrata subsp. lyrata]